MNKTINMATHILDVAQQLIQTRGYNAFSYADIASQVGIRTATIHYYFPTKADLGREVVVSVSVNHACWTCSAGPIS